MRTYLDNYLLGNPTESKLYGDITWNAKKRINYALSFIKNNFTRIYESYARIVSFRRKYLLDSLTNFSEHKSNNGLLLAFLQLFDKERQSLNTFTDRPLDFIIKMIILRMPKRSPVADSAHIVFTIVKNTETHPVEKGLLLLAGKDGKGKELIYETTSDISINKSEITAIKSIFLDMAMPGGGIYAAEVTNSLDGKGKDLERKTFPGLDMDNNNQYCRLIKKQ